MGRKQTIIIFPHLNDCGGKLSGTWYVEYQYHIPGELQKRKERVYKGLNQGTEENRRKKAKAIIAEKTKWLKSGAYLKENNLTAVYADELTYRQEARLYGKIKSGMPLMRKNVSDYLNFVKPIINNVSYADRVSKLRLFTAFLENNHLADLHPQEFDRMMIIDFVVYLSEEHGFSRVTVKKYIQVVRWYFDFEIDRKNTNFNPVVRIPNTGRVVDEAAVPFTEEELQKLKKAIAKANPQLWLACLIQFYCAIRPGTELRLMKIEWIDFDKQQIRVPSIEAKNNISEIVEIPTPLMTVFIHHKLNTYDRSFYVLGKGGGVPGPMHWGKNHFRMEFNKYRKAADIPGNRKFYSWKHTGAIDLIENGAQPFDLMDHLRHKNFDTTEKYIRKRVKHKERKIDRYAREL